MTLKPQVQIVTPSVTEEVDDNLIALVEALEDIDENQANAILNEKSMITNNGSRIYY